MTLADHAAWRAGALGGAVAGIAMGRVFAAFTLADGGIGWILVDSADR